MKVRRIDFYADEFLGGVTNLSAQDIGVYWVACCIMYADGGPIPEDHPRFRTIKIRKNELKLSLERLVAVGKLYRSGSLLVQARVQGELERASKRIQRSHENGSKGGRPPHDNNDLDKPTGFPLGYENENPPETHGATNNQQQTTSNKQRASRMCAEMPFDPEWRQWAIDFGFPADKVEQEFDSFKDYWCGVSGKDGLKIDWRGTWRNRIRSAKDRLTNSPSNKPLKNFGWPVN